MDKKREQIKMKIYYVLYIVFTVATYIAAFLVMTRKWDNVGGAVILMLFGVMFGICYKNSKKALEKK